MITPVACWWCLVRVMAVLLKVARYRKSEDKDDMKRFVAWRLERQRQQQPGERIVFIYDFTDAGIMNMVRSAKSTNMWHTGDNKRFKGEECSLVMPSYRPRRHYVSGCPSVCACGALAAVLRPANYRRLLAFTTKHPVRKWHCCRLNWALGKTA